jgi:hypothetical protein
MPDSTAASSINKGPEASILRQLSTLDRFLPLWIGLAMLTGLALGRLLPGLNDALDEVKIDDTSLPIAIGLLGMMYPVLARVRYDRLRDIATDRPLISSSLFLNWIVGPALMFALAWIFLPDLPEYRTGLILVGLARCIAMVLIWNHLACGDGEAAAVLVVLNSIFQVAGYALLGYFYLEMLPGWLGLDQTAVDFVIWDIARSVLIFLGCRPDNQQGWPHGERGRLVRDAVSPAHCACGPVQPVVHDRYLVRNPGRVDHVPALRCRSHRDSPALLFWIDVVRSVRLGGRSELHIPEDCDSRLHGRGEQLRAGDRRCHWRLRHRIGRGFGRRRRTAD